MTPRLIEEKYVWSRRLTTAKVALASTRDEHFHRRRVPG